MEIFNKIEEIWVEKGDKRSGNWFILSSPVPIIIILGVYYALLKHIMPALFEGRKHLNYRFLLAIYYVTHCALSAYYVYMFVYGAIVVNFNFRCQPVIEDFEGPHFEIAAYSHGYLWYKISELLESILEVFVLGKVSTFVFIHHIIAVFGHVIAMHFYLGGSPMVFGTVNAANHIVLYAFYSMHALSEDFRQYSKQFFKKYHYWATIAYFLMSFVYYLQMETREDCNFNIFRGIMLTILLLFSILSGYMRIEYIKPKAKVLPQEMLTVQISLKTSDNFYCEIEKESGSI